MSSDYVHTPTEMVTFQVGCLSFFKVQDVNNPIFFEKFKTKV